MNIMILGGAGFIGTNLTIKFAENNENKITVVDTNKDYFSSIEKFHYLNVEFKESFFDENMDFSDF